MPDRRPFIHALERDGVRLACTDFGGAGTPVLLLHGLCGYGGEWRDTASWLVRSCRVHAPDARGHGASTRRPSDVSRDAHVGDVVLWLEQLELGPSVLVGQSLGGHTAFLVAARRPDLVRALVVVESTPEALPHGQREVREWLETWPVPFSSREAALGFFGGDTLWARSWVDGLEPCGDGLRPRFDGDVMVASLAELAESAFWDEWARVRCPTLIVRAELGVSREATDRMARLHRDAEVVEIADAGHDAHLEQPARWRRSLESFLGRVAHSTEAR